MSPSGNIVREDLISKWIKPSSESEKLQQDRAERMVNDAIAKWAAFDGCRGSIRVYTKGSYPNETNVRRDSDVDVVVELTECFYYDYFPSSIAPEPRTIAPYNGTWTPRSWRSEVTKALYSHFGLADVDATGKIAIQVAAVPGSRPSIDVVPSFEYHRYEDAAGRIDQQGSCVFDTNLTKIVNWPEQQLQNGRRKNVRTGYRYKNYVRALKNAENVLAANGAIKDLPSYFMECLVFNVADSTLKSGDLTAGFSATLYELWTGLNDESIYREWAEPNYLKYLLRGGAKWTVDDGKALVLGTWDYLGFGE